VLHHLHGSFPLGHREDGEASEPELEPDQDFGSLRPSDVLSRARSGPVLRPIAQSPL